MRSKGRSQAGMFCAVSVEVRAERHHDGRGAALVHVDERIEEARSACFVGAESERLLELVDDEQCRGTTSDRTSQFRLRVRSRRHHSDGAVSSSAEGRDETRSDKRGLPASGRPHHGHESAFGDLVDRVRHDFLAPEEQVPVLGLECHQAPIRAGAGPRRDRELRSHERPRSDPASSSRLGQLGEADLRRKSISDRRGDPFVHQHLFPLSELQESRRHGHDLPLVGAGTWLRLSHGKRHSRVESAGEFASRLQAILGGRERCEQRAVVCR